MGAAIEKGLDMFESESAIKGNAFLLRHGYS